MYLYLFVLFSCVTTAVASDSQHQKCLIVVPIGKWLNGTFVKQSTSKIKIDPMCTLQELQHWLHKKHGIGALYFCNMRDMLSPHITAGLQQGSLNGAGFVQSNFKIPLPTDEEVENSYVSIIPTYAQKNINDLQSPCFGGSEDLIFRFILNNAE